jgi:hypothetical protein
MAGRSNRIDFTANKRVCYIGEGFNSIDELKMVLEDSDDNIKQDITPKSKPGLKKKNYFA